MKPKSLLSAIMFSFYVLLVSAFAPKSILSHDSTFSKTVSDEQSKENYEKLPLMFVPNMGQYDERVCFAAQNSFVKVYFTKSEVVYEFCEQTQRAKDFFNEPSFQRKGSANGTVLRVEFQAANKDVHIESCGNLPGKINIFRGENTSEWFSNIQTYGKIVYKDIWPNIDLVYR